MITRWLSFSVLVGISAALSQRAAQAGEASPLASSVPVQGSASKVMAGGAQRDAKASSIDRERLELDKRRLTFEISKSEDGYAHWKDVAASLQSLATALALVVGGIWAAVRFWRQREAYPHVEFTADIFPIEKRQDWLIVELVSLVENKGKVQQRIKKFEFNLFALFPEDSVVTKSEYGDQAYYPNKVAAGSWMPNRVPNRAGYYFFIEPGVKAKYSYVARVPARATSMMLHSWFEYSDGKHSHSAERTVSQAQLFPPECPGPS